MKLQRIKSDKVRKYARGQRCTMRLPGVCRDRVDTVVLCHLNGAGWALKCDDIGEAFFACAECHAVFDHKVPADYYDDETLMGYARRAVQRTLRILWRDGVIHE